MQQRNRTFKATFIAPAIALYGIFVVYAFVEMIGISLFNWDGFGPLKNFVGLKNYVYALSSSAFEGHLYRALLDNLYFFALILVLVSIVGVSTAYVLSVVRQGASRFFLVIYFLPIVIPPVVVAYLWSMYLEPGTGAVAATLSSLHLNALNVPFLGKSSTALPTLAVITAWATTGYYMFILLPALNNVPKELLEAARIDGASEARTFRSIILPMIMPTYWTVTTMLFVAAFALFDYVYILEGPNGSPNGTTAALATLSYETAFGSSQGGGGGSSLSLGAAVGAVGFVVVVIGATVLLSLQRRAARKLL